MMKARLIKNRTLVTLKSNVTVNLEKYRTSDFEFLDFDGQNYIEINNEIDVDLLSSISCTADNHNEFENCKIMNQVLEDLTPYMARDERLWVYLTHTSLLHYSRQRWPIPNDDEKAVKHILTHFFVRGSRGFERDNSAARLWWMAYLCNKAEDLTLDESLTVFLYMTDVRANIVERPTTSQNNIVFGAVIKKLYDSYNSDKALFGRDIFRAIMKELNLRGGVKLLNAYSKEKVEELLDDCISKAS